MAGNQVIATSLARFTKADLAAEVERRWENSPMFRAFTDKLSAEIRIMIYGYVFGSSDVVTSEAVIKDSSAKAGNKRALLLVEQTTIPTDIFAVNRQISREAIETFYKLKTIRGSPRALMSLMELPDFVEKVERVQVSGFISQQWNNGLDEEYYPLLHEARPRLLRMRTFSVLMDRPHEPGRAYTESQCVPINDTVRGMFKRYEFVSTAEMKTKPNIRSLQKFMGKKVVYDSSKLKCTDIGRYKWYGANLGNVEFIRSNLVKNWPSVLTTPRDYNALEDVKQFHTQWGMSGTLDELAMAYGAQTSLRCWIGLYSQLFGNGKCEALIDQGGPYSDDETRLLNFSVSIREDYNHHDDDDSSPLDLAFQHSKFDPSTGERVTALHALNKLSHPEVLEWATELIATNHLFFRKRREFNPNGLQYCSAHWVELNGGEHSGKEYAEQTEEVEVDGIQVGRRQLREEFKPKLFSTN